MINLVKKVSREGEEALLQVPPSSLGFLAEALEVSLVVVAHSREGRTPSTHPAPGVDLVEADSTRRIQTRFSSEHFSGFGRVIE